MLIKTHFVTTSWLLFVFVFLLSHTSCLDKESGGQHEDVGSLTSSGELPEDKIPVDLDECFALLKRTLSKEELSDFKSTPEHEVIGKFHMGLGLRIRNSWIHRTPSPLKQFFRQKGINHPDDMSAIILVSFHRLLNSQPINLEEQLAYWREFKIPSINRPAQEKN